MDPLKLRARDDVFDWFKACTRIKPSTNIAMAAHIVVCPSVHTITQTWHASCGTIQAHGLCLGPVMMDRPTFVFEEAWGMGPVAGVDEVGYGAWAGPVVVAAVVCRCAPYMPDFVNHVHDSKKMTPQQRNWVFDAFLDHSSWGYSVVDWVPVQAINTGCVLRLTLSAMARVAAGAQARHVLVDGCRGLPTSISHQCIQKGDQKSVSIALASIVAKVMRDRLMTRLAVDHPLFHWDQNKGYGTALHQRAIQRHGITKHHRVGYCRRALGLG